MPIATSDAYVEMLDKAKSQGYALPAINVTSSQTLNAALRGFADAESDGIIQVSLGTALYLSGPVQRRTVGSKALAAYAHEVADAYSVNVALHTDHCPVDNLDDWVRPLLHDSIERVRSGKQPLFQSHMWDGSALPMRRNLEIAAELLDLSVMAGALLEIEIGVVGGVEDGIGGHGTRGDYTTTDDARAMVEALGLGERGKYLSALTFGNVHGVFSGATELRPDILGDIQAEIGAEHGMDRPLNLVFHGGSGSPYDDVRAAISHGVVKMNLDTDTQYAFSSSIAKFMMTHVEDVLKIDGALGDKKFYDPRSWGKPAEASMAKRVVEAADLLGSAGCTVGRSS